MRVIRLTDPSFEPVTLTEAKKHLPVDFSDDDFQVMAFISAARRRVEDYCCRSFVSASWAVLFDGQLPIGDAAMLVPIPDVSTVTSVKYRDLDGVVQTWASENYSFDPEREELRPVNAWPDGTQMRVEVVAGRSSTYGVPEPIKVSILLYMAETYENRQAGMFTSENYELNPRVLEMLQPYRVRMGI